MVLSNLRSGLQRIEGVWVILMAGREVPAGRDLGKEAHGAPPHGARWRRAYRYHRLAPQSLPSFGAARATPDGAPLRQFGSSSRLERAAAGVERHLRVREARGWVKHHTRHGDHAEQESLAEPGSTHGGSASWPPEMKAIQQARIWDCACLLCMRRPRRHASAVFLPRSRRGSGAWSQCQSGAP